MPLNNTKISVLMPAYNCGKYIESAVYSILNQTYKDFEFIIIDDGSTDDTEEIIHRIKDSRISYTKTANRGTSAALNYGVSLCSNEWIARIDADDLNTNTRLEKQVNFINENPELDVVSSWSVYFKDPAKILFLLKEPQGHNEIYKYLDIHNPINQSAMICRKTVLEKYRYNEALNSNEDYELMFRIRDEVKFHNMPEFLVYTRFRKDSRTSAGRRDNLFDMLHTEAFKKMMDSKSKGDHFYNASVIAWLNYFYNDRKNSRSYFRNSFSLKNTAAYFTTFLPDKYFFKFIDSRLKYRLKYRFKNIFSSNSEFRKELRSLLNSNNFSAVSKQN